MASIEPSLPSIVHFRSTLLLGNPQDICGSADVADSYAIGTADLGWFDSYVLIELRVGQRQLNSLLNLLHLLLKASHICIGFQGSLLHLLLKVVCNTSEFYHVITICALYMDTQLSNTALK